MLLAETLAGLRIPTIASPQLTNSSGTAAAYNAHNQKGLRRPMTLHSVPTVGATPKTKPCSFVEVDVL